MTNLTSFFVCVVLRRRQPAVTTLSCPATPRWNPAWPVCRRRWCRTRRRPPPPTNRSWWRAAPRRRGRPWALRCLAAPDYWGRRTTVTWPCCKTTTPYDSGRPATGTASEARLWPPAPPPGPRGPSQSARGSCPGAGLLTGLAKQRVFFKLFACPDQPPAAFRNSRVICRNEVAPHPGLFCKSFPAVCFGGGGAKRRFSEMDACWKLFLFYFVIYGTDDRFLILFRAVEEFSEPNFPFEVFNGPELIGPVFAASRFGVLKSYIELSNSVSQWNPKKI